MKTIEDMEAETIAIYNRGKIEERYAWALFLTTCAGVGGGSGYILVPLIDKIYDNEDIEAAQERISHIIEVQAKDNPGQEEVFVADGTNLSLDGVSVNIVKKTSYSALIQEQKDQVTRIENSGLREDAIGIGSTIGVGIAFACFTTVFSGKVMHFYESAGEFFYNKLHAPKNDAEQRPKPR